MVNIIPILKELVQYSSNLIYCYVLCCYVVLCLYSHFLYIKPYVFVPQCPGQAEYEVLIALSKAMVLKALDRIVNDDLVSQGQHMITQGLLFPYSRNMRVCRDIQY